MTATLTQPVTQTRTTTTPSTGSGGFPPRTYVRADGGGGGGGGGNNQVPNWDEFEAPSVTQSQFDIEMEKGMQKDRGLKLKRLYQQCRTSAEAIKTEEQKTLAQAERTATGVAQVALAKTGTELVNAKNEVLKTNITIEAEKWSAQQVKLGMAQDQTAFLTTSRQGAGMLMLHQLQGMQLQGQLAAAQNAHQQEMMQLRGWDGAALPPGQEQPLASSFSRQAFGGQAQAASPRMPDVFNKNGLKLRPITGLGRRW